MFRWLRGFGSRRLDETTPLQGETANGRQSQDAKTEMSAAEGYPPLFPRSIERGHAEIPVDEDQFLESISAFTEPVAMHAHQLEPSDSARTIDGHLVLDGVSEPAEELLSPAFMPALEQGDVSLDETMLPHDAFPAEPEVGRVDNLRSAAMSAMANEGWEQAESEWAALREIAPTEIPAFVQGAEALWRLGRVKEADALLAEAVVAFPNDLWTAHSYANFAARCGDWPAARDRWKAVRDHFPDDMAGYANGAAALIHLGALDGAEDLVQWTLNHHPDSADGWIHSASLAGHRAAWSEAAKKWEAVRSRFPNLAVGYGAAVEPLVQLGRYDEAKTVVDLGVSKHPDNLWLAYIQAELPGRQGNWDAASRLWMDVCERFREDFSSYQNAAFAHVMAGQVDTAEAILVDACARFPNRSELMCQCADLYMRQQRWAKAIALWTKIRDKFPDETRAYAGGITALKEGGSFDEADKVSELARQRFPNIFS